MGRSARREREYYVRSMFARIARHYDRANRWMTWGQDVRWRQQLIDLAHLPHGGKLLDIGTGTGDLALEASRRDASLLVVGADLTPEMMGQGRIRTGAGMIHWLNSDALDLPFSSETFDAVVSGYLLRNVSNLEMALTEQYRVLKQGGHAVCLDTTPPPGNMWYLPARLYLRYFIPIIGRLMTGDGNAYGYLQGSTERFIHAEELVDCFVKAGFKDVYYRRFMAATMAIHHGTK